MNERDVFLEFAKAVVATPLALILFALDLVGVGAVIYWVVDDLLEGAVTAIFLAVILFSQYLVFRKVRRELYIYQQGQPKIRFTESRQAQMYHDSPIIRRRTPTYQIIQAWFTNIPHLQITSSIAKNVTARINFFTVDDIEILDYHGQWAKSNAPDNVGFDDILDEVEIPPGHIQSKLIIALHNIQPIQNVMPSPEKPCVQLQTVGCPSTGFLKEIIM